MTSTELTLGEQCKLDRSLTQLHHPPTVMDYYDAQRDVEVRKTMEETYRRLPSESNSMLLPSAMLTPENIMRRAPQYKLKNTIASFAMNVGIDIGLVNEKNISYFNRHHFPAQIIPLQVLPDPINQSFIICRVMVFQTGSGLVIGASSEEIARCAVTKFQYMMRKQTGMDIQCRDVQMRSFVATVAVEGRINLPAMYKRWQSHAVYDPDSFIGLEFSLQFAASQNVTFVVYASGKYNIVGVKNKGEIGVLSQYFYSEILWDFIEPFDGMATKPTPQPDQGVEEDQIASAVYKNDNRKERTEIDKELMAQFAEFQKRYETGGGQVGDK